MSKTKFYLRPLGILNKKDGSLLIKKDQAFIVNGFYFTHIELISRNKLIKKKTYQFSDFKKILEKKKKLEIFSLILVIKIIKLKKSYLKIKDFPFLEF